MVSDSFSKGHVTKNSSVTSKTIHAKAAAGAQAHRDGYNVVYGDGHGAWYGDPQQRAIWWDMTNRDSAYANMYSGMNYWNWMQDTQQPAAEDSRYRRLDGGWAIWHFMDMAAGVDAEAQYNIGRMGY